MNETFKRLNIIEVECACSECSRMCHSPCCGTVEEIALLIERGYGDRLMLDDDPNDINPEPIIKPAVKGYEGKRAPYETGTQEGCTFWKNGLCELHGTGLKPFQGRFALHRRPYEETEAIADVIRKSWNTGAAMRLIAKFKKMRKIGKRPE